MKKYTLGDLKRVTNKEIQGKIGMLTDQNGSMDEAVRDLVTHPRMKFPSTIKVKSLIPSVSDDSNRYKSPDDLNSKGVIDIMKRGVSFTRSYGLSLTTPEQFRSSEAGYLDRQIAIDQFNGNKYINFYDDERHGYILDDMDSTDGWVAVGAATDLRIDRGEFKVGEGALNFDIIPGGTYAGVKLTLDYALDITEDTLANGELFTWSWVPNIEKITEVVLQIGSSSVDYYRLSSNKQYDGSDLVVGWNLVSFSVVDAKVMVGAPDITNIKHISLTFPLTDPLFEVESCRFDNIVIHRGRPFDVKYYSLNIWRDHITLQPKETGENDGDFLEINSDEWAVIKQSALAVASSEVDIDRNLVVSHKNELKGTIAEFSLENPSRALTMITSYYKSEL